ncbi:stage V sporulation protein AE [Candidatus Formimonas warabiya]|uniref:Stage V sporulation protein AE n=1 Tax=Formimonas warabiya TaxID=1761012 RepID=A0A3G1KNL8_FORW1|nr:stage V sporulation protein AE [Candidatus Formimonas warabiya]ATW24081.1 stage V sporulation protein AE [Candidatus Formimonas warabiya]
MMSDKKRKVIIITDGDEMARKTVERVAANIGGCCISASAGNPTPISGEKILALIKKTNTDPVLIMLDDKGCRQKGKGERALEFIVKHPDIEVLGVVAVASNTKKCKGVEVEQSITLEGKVIDRPVNKDGEPEPEGHHILEGDTVSVLESLKIPTIIGIGDIGKMHGRDKFERGARITTQAVKYILERGGFVRE